MIVAVVYASVAGLLLWALAGARPGWRVKLAAIVLVPALSVAVWHAFQSRSGWPTASSPPAHALFVARAVREPDAATGKPGAIWLWLVPAGHGGPLGYQPGRLEPRAYRLPYSRQLHEQAERAQQQTQHGRLVEVDRRPPHGKRGGQRTRFRMYALPPTQPPVKGRS
jgi:hypothetical protein